MSTNPVLVGIDVSRLVKHIDKEHLTPHTQESLKSLMEIPKYKQKTAEATREVFYGLLEIHLRVTLNKPEFRRRFEALLGDIVNEQFPTYEDLLLPVFVEALDTAFIKTSQDESGSHQG